MPKFRIPTFTCRQGLAVVLAALLLLALVMLGGRQSAEAKPERILSLAPSITEMLYALELGDRVVGVTSYCNYPPAAAKKPRVGAALELNEELVIALRPTLILAAEGDAARRDRLARLTGAKVVLIETRHVKDIWKNMAAIGALTATEARARVVVGELQQKLAAKAASFKARKLNRSVFYMVWDAPLMTAGPESYLHDLIGLAGGQNIVSTRTGGAYPAYSTEALLAANPQVILGPQNMASGLQALSRRYPHLAAVKSRRVRTLPDDLISRPGPRVVEALDAVGQAMR